MVTVEILHSIPHPQLAILAVGSDRQIHKVNVSPDSPRDAQRSSSAGTIREYCLS